MNSEIYSPSSRSRHTGKSLVHASQAPATFETPGEVLRLRDVVSRTRFNKGMCFRLLYTLHQCGFLEKVGQNNYRLASEIRRRRRCRIGYAAQGQDTSFPHEVGAGLARAALTHSNRKLPMDASDLDAMVGASVHHYNSAEEVERFCAAPGEC